MSPEPTDEQLMQRFCSTGDKAAFGQLFSRLGPKVRSFLRPMVKDAALVEDLSQATFMSIVRSRDRYQVGMPVAPWVFAIAANAARDALRRRSANVEQLSTDAEGKQPEGMVESQPTDHGLQRELQNALQALPVAQREVVILHKIQGLSFEQVAEGLGITSTAARIRAHRGYVKLRALLKHLEGA